jgi:hypothetical protein
MIQSILLCGVLLFALAEPACDASTSDAKNEAHQPAKPEPGCANMNCTELKPASTPDYGPDPTFEATDSGGATDAGK